MSLKQKTFKALGWSAAQTWLSRGVSFLVFTILARLIAPEAFGLVVIAVVFTELIQAIVNEGFGDAIVQRKELEPEHLDTAFWTAIGIGVLLTVLMSAFASLIANLYGQPELLPILRWMSLTFLIAALSKTQKAILIREMGFKCLAIRSLLAALAGGAVGIAMALLGFGVWSLVCLQLFGSGFGTIALWSVAHWRPHFRFSLRHFRELYAFGASVALAHVLTTVSRRLNDLLVGLFLGPVALGYYYLGVRVVSVLSESFLGFAKSVAFPMFSRMHGNPERMRNGVYRVTELAVVASLPVFAGLAVVAPELVRVVFGEKWDASIPIVQILAVGGLLQSISFHSVLLKAAGKPEWNLRMMVVHSALSLGALLVAIPYGIVEVAISYVAVRIVLWPFWMMLVKKLIQVEVRVYLRQALGPILATVAMVGAVLLLRSMFRSEWNEPSLLAASILCGAAAYVAILRCASPALFENALNVIRPFCGFAGQG